LFATHPAIRVAMVVLALLWTQFPFGGGARAEGGHALELCCAWGSSLADGELTYSVSSADAPSGDVFRSAVREWDDVLPGLRLAEQPVGSKVDIAILFTDQAGRTEGQAVTSFTRRGLIRKVEVSIQGGRAPENVGGLIQIGKHEFGHALGLGHANFDGNLMSEAVSPQPTPIPACVINGVVEANRWKLVDPQAKKPVRPSVGDVSC
jgi:hypothetical protein